MPHDDRFEHLATVREGIRTYVCFAETSDFVRVRKILQPMPDKPQVYVEELVHLPVSQHGYAVEFREVDDETWHAVVKYLIDEELVKELDLAEGYHDLVGVLTRGADGLRKQG